MSPLVPLAQKIRRVLFGVTFLAFLATALVTGSNEYADRHAEFGHIMQAQGKMAQSLIQAQILQHESRIEHIIDDLPTLGSKTAKLTALQNRLHLFDPFDSFFVLDERSKVVAVSVGHEHFLGLDLSGLEPVKRSQKISQVYQSPLSKRSVVGIRYPVSKGLTMVYERDIENILPVLQHIETESLIPGQSLFVLSAEGVAVYHADETLAHSRHNLAFDLKKMSSPDTFQMVSYTYQGNKYLAFKNALATPSGWTIYFQFPADLLRQATNRAIITQLLNILVFFLIIAFVLQFVLNRFFSKPVSGLVQVLEGFSAGQQEEPIVDPDISGITELAEIGRAINKMAADVNESNLLARQGEERIKLLLNSTAEAIYGLDRQGRCIFCNTAFLKMLRFSSEEELLGKNIHDLIHHSHQDGSSCPSEKCIALQGVMQGKLTHSDEETFFRADGSSFPAECWSHPIIVNGEVEGAVVTFIDISLRKAAQNALLESESRYRTLVENIDLGITLIDADHKVVMANNGQGKLFNLLPESFIGKYCYREFEKRDHVCDHCPGIKAVASGRPEEVITGGVKADGEKFSVRIRAFPLIGADKLSGGFIEVVEDITERLKVEERLATETERLAVTLRSIGDGVITTDTAGRVVLINKVAENLTGWRQEEAFGRPLLEVFRIINEHTRQPCENPVEKVLATGKIIGLANHTALIAKDGQERSIADSGAPIRDQKSDIIGVVLVFRDVTEQLRLEQELLKAKKLESIGVLAGGIAHDFNNILVAILGNLNLAASLLPPEHRLFPLLKDAEKASLRAKDLTQQLLTFSKGGEPVKEASSLTDIIKDSARFILHGQKAACLFDLPDDLWLVNIDKGQMSQVIQNIIMNASHAMPDGGTITISCRNIDRIDEEHVLLPDDEKYVRITIEDTGVGIPPEIIDKIFDPYFSTKEQGSGLGLAITHSIINKHNGHISVQSPPGRGTTFTIFLPASTVNSIELLEQSFSPKAKAAKILIMDDDTMVQEVAQTMLSFLGHETVVAADGQEAIDLFLREREAGSPFDLLIMDLTIPGGMGGKEAVQEVLRIDPRAKVIVSSGYSNDPIMANYRQYGFAANITKPYLLETLQNVIGNLLS